MRCPFCDYAGPSKVLAELQHSYVIRPIDPVVHDHKLVVSREHLPDALFNAYETSLVMRDAVLYAKGQGYGRNSLNINIITSVGPHATQTVPHLHIHLVPRREGDRLALPWTEAE